MKVDLRDALVADIGAAFEASGHPYSYYLFHIAADTALKTIERFAADEPKIKKTTKKSA